jgi:hypothetical protein
MEKLRKVGEKAAEEGWLLVVRLEKESFLKHY